MNISGHLLLWAKSFLVLPLYTFYPSPYVNSFNKSNILCIFTFTFYYIIYSQLKGIFGLTIFPTQKLDFYFYLL